MLELRCLLLPVLSVHSTGARVGYWLQLPTMDLVSASQFSVIAEQPRIMAGVFTTEKEPLLPGTVAGAGNHLVEPGTMDCFLLA